ncbi:FBD-associated F-box protein At4g10400 isoform X1 [Arachis ipaensis]|uniref:FBD-associated F-box protein At4g10400 isoform X1 n=1 Tax=Arachis ipaensis TaxID=130454 RepID=UPI0007AFC26D|nr:FBD-associated F-box protein At4g10400 isoform X1 [Arachis ipaensis]XP_025674856.1 FBD-associated F-box protein At4g10400 isoform X1 [Arachis hypogaea]
MAETSTASKRSMGTDIISSLPNSLLCHILSFLPTLYAVRTSILSRQWRHLWKDLQVFDFDDTELNWSNERFALFIDAVLSQLRFPHIRNLSLSCQRGLDNNKVIDNAIDNAIGRWIRAAVGPCLQEMILYSSYGEFYPDYFDGIFTCASLVSLTLGGNLVLDVIPWVYLPLLKDLTLLLGVSVEHDFISGCPALENLYIDYYGSLYPEIHFLSTSLKRLSLFEVREFDDPIISEIQIDTPNLEYLRIFLAGSCVTSLVISDFPKIMEACLEIAPLDEHVAWLPKLIQALSKTKILDFGWWTTECLVEAPNLHLPEFSCLHELSICYSNFNSGVLIKLLCCCPKLQLLGIDINGVQYFRDQTPQSSWTQPASVPSCVMSHLNIFEFRSYSDSSEEREFLAYILQNALVLKRLIIYAKIGSFEKEEHILSEISVLPRGSSICQVEARILTRTVQPVPFAL